MQKPAPKFPLKFIGIILLLLRMYTASAQETGKDSTAAAALLTEARSVFLSDKPAALSKTLTGLEIAEKINNKPLQGSFNNLLGVLYTYQAKFDLSAKYLNHAKEIAIALKDKVLLSKVYTNLGLNYMQLGQQLPAITESQNAIKVLEELGMTGAFGDTYANISNSYIRLEMFDKALFYADSAFKYFKQINKLSGLANIYNNYGLIFAKKEQFTKSLDYYTKSLKIKEQFGDKGGQANSLVNLGTTYYDLKDNNQALACYKKAETLFLAVGDSKGVASARTNIAQIKADLKDTSGVSYSRNAYEYAKNHSALEEQKGTALALYHNYEVAKDFANAFFYRKVYDSLNNLIINESMLKQIALLETRFQTEKKQQQIKLLSKQNTIQQLQIGKKDLTIYIIAIVFALSAVIAYQLYSRNKIKQQSKLQAAIAHQQNLAARGIIDAEERERKRIAGDLHDGVGQLFSAVRLNLGVLVNKYVAKGPEADLLAEKSMAMVDESCTEVRSIAHQMMPNALIKSGLISAVRDFVNKIQSDKLKIAVQAEGIDKPLDDNVETVLYRVIQESVNNVIKHAGASMLDIFLLRDDDEITVTIEDNGKGFDSGDKSKFDGIGLKNIVSRVEFLKGTVDISSQPGKGTLVAIYVPLG